MILFKLKKRLLKGNIQVRKKLKSILDKRRANVAKEEKELLQLKQKIKSLNLRKKLTPSQKKLLLQRKKRKEKRIRATKIILRRTGKKINKYLTNFARNTKLVSRKRLK